VPAAILAFITGDIEKGLKFEKWGNPIFFVMFLSSCVMG